MIVGYLGRSALAGALAAVFLAVGPASAQQAEADPAEARRRGVAEGAASCKANISTAPSDLAIGEIEAFCSCMGANEFAMASMDEATKGLLRPRQQQTCLADIRKGSTPVQAAAPASPPATTAPAPAVPASPPAAAVAAPPPQAAPAVPAPTAQPPAPARKLETWTLATNRGGAPIAYVRAIPNHELTQANQPAEPPRVEAAVMYCRSKDSVGLRVLFKPGVREDGIRFSYAGEGEQVELDRYGAAAQKNWAAVAREWQDIETRRHGTAAQDPISDTDFLVEATFMRKQGASVVFDTGGNLNFAGITAMRNRLREQCAEAIGRGVKAGNFETTGVAGFPAENLPPHVTGRDNASLAPSPKPGEKIESEVDCRLLITKTLNSVEPKLDSAMQLWKRAVATNAGPLGCKALRALNAAQNELKSSLSACSSFDFIRNGIKGANEAIANNNKALRGLHC